ncbi:MAG: hypothetical protein RR047_02610 [Bacilli bacterium]
MELRKGEYITLEDSAEYLVVETLTCGMTNYLFLMLANSPLELFIAKEQISNQDIFVTIITDREEKRYAMDMLLKGELKLNFV